jgi:hypothetical protein
MVVKVINTPAYFDTKLIKTTTVKCLIVQAPDNIKMVVKVINTPAYFDTK